MMIATYPPSDLPNGFKYPVSFLSLLNSDRLVVAQPWLLLDAGWEVSRRLLAHGLRDERVLIPFASLETGDGDAACFDGRDTTGNPPVVMLILDGSGREYGYKDFDHWLEAAQADAEGYAG